MIDPATTGSGIWLSGGAIAVLASAITLGVREGVAALKHRRNGNGSASKPGTGPVCQKHGEDIVALLTDRNNHSKMLTEIRQDIKTLLGRR